MSEAYFIILDLIMLIITGNEFKSWHSLLCSFYFTLLGSSQRSVGSPV
jgi:hypothetical protein